MRGTFDFSLPTGKAIQCIEQFRLLSLLNAICEQIGVAKGAGVDSQLEGTKHLQFRQLVDQGLFARICRTASPLPLLLLPLLLLTLHLFHRVEDLFQTDHQVPDQSLGGRGLLREGIF